MTSNKVNSEQMNTFLMDEYNAEVTPHINLENLTLHTSKQISPILNNTPLATSRNLKDCAQDKSGSFSALNFMTMSMLSVQVFWELFLAVSLKERGGWNG